MHNKANQEASHFSCASLLVVSHNPTDPQVGSSGVATCIQRQGGYLTWKHGSKQCIGNKCQTQS